MAKFKYVSILIMKTAILYIYNYNICTTFMISNPKPKPK